MSGRRYCAWCKNTHTELILTAICFFAILNLNIFFVSFSDDCWPTIPKRNAINHPKVFSIRAPISGPICEQHDLPGLLRCRHHGQSLPEKVHVEEEVSSIRASLTYAAMSCKKNHNKCLSQGPILFFNN